MNVYRLILIGFLFFTSSIYAADKILKIAVPAHAPPFVIQGANNKFYGFDVVLVERICKTLEYECQLVVMPNNQLLSAVETQKVDLAIGSIIITPERASKVFFSSPYFISRLRFLGPGTLNEKHITPQLLSGKNIGITDSVYAPELKKYGVKDTQIVIYQEENALIKALSSGNIQLALLDNSTAVYWHRNSSGNLKVIDGPVAFGYGIGIAISSKDLSLLEPINEALLKYQNSEAFIFDFHKYLGTIYDF